MTKTSINDIRRQVYMDAYCENSKKIDYRELTEEQGVQKVFYDELPNRVMNGYPVASDFVSPDGTAYDMNSYYKLSKEEQKACRLRYYYLPCCHELCAGTTGSGKTTGCVEPQLRAIAYQKDKPHIFATDPKGELFEKHSAFIREQGYEIYVLNFRDIFKSHSWNPLAEIYDEKMKLLNLGKNFKERSGSTKGYKLFDPEDEYGEIFYTAGKNAFASMDTFFAWYGVETELQEAKIEQLVHQFCHNAITIESAKDPVWEYGARELLQGIILAMLEDVENPSVGLERNQFTIKTVYDFYMNLRVPIVTDECSLDNHPLIKGRNPSTIDYFRSSLNNAPNTMKSYVGVFDNKMRSWFQSYVYQITNETTFDVRKVAKDKPIAVFVSTRDYEKSDYFIATSFIDYFYRAGIEMAEEEENARPIHFILDEFGNIPQITDFENKIATSRSRNMWFHLYVQSYDQLENIYGAHVAEIIRDNCNGLMFLGSQNRKTLEKFSESCGKRTVPSFRSYLGMESTELTEVPLLPISQLDLIEPGHIYLKRLFMPLITAQYIRSYVVAEQGSYKDYKKSIDSGLFGKRTRLADVTSPYDRSKKYKRRQATNNILDEWGVFDD